MGSLDLLIDPELERIYQIGEEVMAERDRLVMTEGLLESSGVLKFRESEDFALFDIDASSEFALLAQFIETVRFAIQFKRSPEDIKTEYSPYNPYSKYNLAVDLNTKQPIGMIRIISPDSEGRLKSIEDMFDPFNSWRAEIAKEYFDGDDKFDDSDAIRRMVSPFGIGDLDTKRVVDGATRANVPWYIEQNKDLSLASALFHTGYASLVRRQEEGEIDYLISIQDMTPLELSQAFGEPYDLFEGLNPHMYAVGDEKDDELEPSIPVLLRIADFKKKITDSDKDLLGVGNFLLNGTGLEGRFMLPSNENYGSQLIIA